MLHHSSNSRFVPVSFKQLPQNSQKIQRVPRKSLVNPIMTLNQDQQYKFQWKQKNTMKTSCIQTSTTFSNQSNSKKANYSEIYYSSQILRNDAGNGQKDKNQLKTNQTASKYIPRYQRAKMCISQIYSSSSENQADKHFQNEKKSSNQKKNFKKLQNLNGLEYASFKKVNSPQITSSKTIPSFILKRKQAKENSNLLLNVNQIHQVSCENKNTDIKEKIHYKTQKQISHCGSQIFKKCSIQQGIQIREPNPFDQFQKLKLSYPKATASTISSQLQSYQSMKSLHDLQDFHQFQKPQKTMENNQYLQRVMNRSKTIAKQRKFNELQYQFNDLFGQEQQKQPSEQLTNQIANELLSLF